MFNSKFSRDVTVHKQLFSEIDMQIANQFNTSTSCMQVIKLTFCVQGHCVGPLNDVVLTLPSHRYTTLNKLNPDCCRRAFQIHKWLHSAVVPNTGHKHTHAYIHVHMRSYMYTREDTCTRICVYTFLHAYLHVRMCRWNRHTRVHLYMHIHVHMVA